MDTIANFLTTIRNAQMAKHSSIQTPYTKMNEKIAKILEEEGYIGKVEIKDLDNNKKLLVLSLKYYKNRPVIEHIKRLSKCSCRYYVKAKEIKSIYSGLGISIISTSKGLMTNRKAKSQNLGGELICEIW